MEKQLTIKDVLISAEFLTGIEQAVKHQEMHRTIALSPGMRFKRGPYEHLKQAGYLSDLVKLATEFSLIITGNSVLPSSHRHFIAALCVPSFEKAKNILLKAVLEPTAEEKLINESREQIKRKTKKKHDTILEQKQAQN